MTLRRLRCILTRHDWETIGTTGPNSVRTGGYEISIPASAIQVCARCATTQMVPDEKVKPEETLDVDAPYPPPEKDAFGRELR